MWVSIFLLLLAGMAHSNESIKSINAIGEGNPAEKHHKVHNLVLYPEKHSWCELKHIRQIVTHAHCKSKEMENFVCVGTCFSYSVPHTEPEIPGDEMLDYCDSCQPQESHWTTIALDCENDGAEYKVTKNIQLITNCSCSACSPSRKPIITNDVFEEPNQRISDLFYKMLPDNHKPDPSLTNIDLKNDMRYSQLSLGDLKKEFDLNADQELLLSGKLLVKDVASFTDNEDEEKIDRAYNYH